MKNIIKKVLIGIIFLQLHGFIYGWQTWDDFERIRKQYDTIKKKREDLFQLPENERQSAIEKHKAEFKAKQLALSQNGKRDFESDIEEIAAKILYDAIDGQECHTEYVDYIFQIGIQNLDQLKQSLNEIQDATEYELDSSRRERKNYSYNRSGYDPYIASVVHDHKEKETDLKSELDCIDKMRARICAIRIGEEKKKAQMLNCL